MRKNKKSWFLFAATMFSLFLAVQVHAQSGPKTLKRPDGTVITYEVFGEAGKKKDALLLVHCWTCNRHYWDKLIPGLAKDYLVVALDLPGHGDSTAAPKKWDYLAMGEAIAAVARELKLQKFIVVGHSMGGPLGLQLAAMMPGQVEGVVCVDTLHNVEFDFKAQGFTMTEDTFQKNIEGFLPQMVHPKSDPSIAPWLIQQSLKADRKVALALWDQFNEANYGAMMAAAKVPIRCVNAVPFNKLSQKTDVNINRKYGDFEVIEMKDIGHYPMLERPEAFLKQLKKAIKMVSSS